MKRIFLSLFSMIAVSFAWAQNGNIVVFSEGGERFTAIVNGERINMESATNVKVTDLNQPGYKLKVIFEDTKLGEVSKDIVVTAGEETVYMVKLDKKGAYKVAWRSSTPIAQAPAAPASQTVYVWGAPATPPVVTEPATTVVVQETVTTTTPGGTPTTTGESVSMNVSAPGFGMTVNVNGGGTTTTQEATSTSVTTTTTSVTTSGQSVSNQIVQPAPVAVVPAPCTMMDANAFEGACNSIRSKSFEDSKLTLAKQVASNNCLNVSQIKTIMGLFAFEDTKLDFAKYAWSYCPDRNNYYLVNDAFTFEASIEELDAFIQAQR